MDTPPGNTVIEASAGTGKTYNLAKHLVTLLKLGVKPQNIVALTFSRAAAGEIFERFLLMLADEAEKSPEGLGLLRGTIAVQHLNAIGTLDGFLLRMARSFPLELGICGEMEMLDEWRADKERDRVSFSVLRRTGTDAGKALARAFLSASGGKISGRFAADYGRFIRRWHDIFLSCPQESAWGQADAIDPRGDMPPADRKDLAAAADAVLEACGADGETAAFASWVRSFTGSFSGAKGYAKKIIEAGPEIFRRAAVEFDFRRRTVSFPGRAGEAVKNAMRAVYGFAFGKALAEARAMHGLLAPFESAYAKSVRSHGRLVFADVPRLVASLSPETRLALEYRLDLKISAWALDEFQDTSREQWNAIGNLVDEAAQPDCGKNVFIVGDRKQAIYGWRNGDVSIFDAIIEKFGRLEELAGSGAYHVEKLKKSWRYGPAMADAVSKIFADGAAAAHVRSWRSPVHESVREKPPGFVQFADAPGANAEDFVQPVFNALRAADPAGRGISAAVLVRTNELGELLARRLKELGLENVAWEGESRILDTPALAPFADLAVLADHPGDSLSWNRFRLSPLCRAIYPDGAPSANEVSAKFAREFTGRGMARTFRDLRALFPANPDETWSEFTERRFAAMVSAAAEFELAMEPGTGLSDFPGFLESKKKRCVAEPGKVKIMTIHRSKGLGFDYTIVPLYEHDPLDKRPDKPLAGNGWILPDPGAAACAAIPAAAAADAIRLERSALESLCTYYVALTRAKTAMTVILHPEGKTSQSLRFSSIVRQALAGRTEFGDRNWAAESAAPANGQDVAPDAPAHADAVARTAPARRKRRTVARRVPSGALRSGMCAGELFAAAGARKAAAKRGTAAHAEYACIEWLEPDKARSGLERALVKPSADATVWRERDYEIFADGLWESGRFDRVVFTGSGENRRAEIFDFKTNAVRFGESEGEFRARMAGEYLPQMSAYRAAVSALAGLPPEKIGASLLLEAVGGAERVF